MTFILKKGWRIAARLQGHHDKPELNCVQFNFSTIQIDFRAMARWDAGMPAY
jgi:hypothetical protein